MEAGVLRGQAGAGVEGRLHRVGPDGRPERVDPDPATSDDATDVRLLRTSDGRDLPGVRLTAVGRARDGGAVRSGETSGRGARVPDADEARHEAERRAAPHPG